METVRDPYRSAVPLSPPPFQTRATGATILMRRLQNLLRRFCKRSIQKPVFRIQKWNPITGNVYKYSDS